MSAVGVIGLGAMGSRIAMRLLDTGHQVYGNNRTAAKAQPLVDRGMTLLETPREVAAAGDVTFSMVTDDAALEAISESPDGLLAGLRPGKVYVDMSTVSPRASRELSARVAEVGARMLDAPVSGSIPQAETGTLAIMVGGDRESFAAAEPLLKELGQTVTYIGPNGQGLLLKLAINVNLAMQAVAFSEGLLLAERGGIDRKLAADVMGSSAIGSPMLKAREPLFLDPPQHAWFDIDLLLKDIRLALQAAAELATPLSSAAMADEILSKAGEAGYGHRDIAALAEFMEHMAEGVAPMADRP